MTQTVADASRSYRQRRAEKLARMEAALREIEKLGGYNSFASEIAAAALTPDKEMGE